jgi:hypothetical protein
MKKEPSKLPFSKVNYQLMVLGILFIGFGYLGMSLDREPYGFGSLGITIGPITVLLGYLIEFLAILYVPKNKKS